MRASSWPLLAIGASWGFLLPTVTPAWQKVVMAPTSKSSDAATDVAVDANGDVDIPAEGSRSIAAPM